jgi:Holliday junction resolvasome RuvABC endonuclease subunit
MLIPTTAGAAMASNRIVRVRNNGEELRVLGIDPSLSSTGYAYRYASELYTGRIDTGKLRGPQRLVYVREQIAQVLDAAQPQLIVYEDYAFGAKQGAHQLGELGGVVKTMLWERGIDVLLVSPTCLKKTFTGRGNADRGQKEKPEMRAAIHNILGYDLAQNDEADAFALMSLGEVRYGNGRHSEGVKKQLRLEALEECQVVRGKGKVLQLIANKS